MQARIGVVESEIGTGWEEARNGAGAAEPGTAVRSAQVGIGRRLIEWYAVQRGLDLLAVETAEKGEVGLKENLKERLVSIGHVAGKGTSERGRRKTKEIWNAKKVKIRGRDERKREWKVESGSIRSRDRGIDGHTWVCAPPCL
jgi:hypothetical protein